MPKYGYHYSETDGAWIDENMNAILDSQIDEEHLKVFLQLTADAAKRQLRNIAKQAKTG
jgi:hypothetical protein